MEKWFYKVMGQEIGPVSFGKLKALAEAGTVSSDSPIRKAGQDNWFFAHQLPELAVAFRTTAFAGDSPTPPAKMTANWKLRLGHLFGSLGQASTIVLILVMGLMLPRECARRHVEEEQRKEIMEALEKGTPIPGVEPRLFEKHKNEVKERCQADRRVQDHQRRVEEAMLAWQNDLEGQPFPQMSVLFQWVKEIRDMAQQEVLANPEIRAMIIEVMDSEGREGAESAVLRERFENRLKEKLLSVWNCERILGELDRRYVQWRKTQKNAREPTVKEMLNDIDAILAEEAP